MVRFPIFIKSDKRRIDPNIKALVFLLAFALVHYIVTKLNLEYGQRIQRILGYCFIPFIVFGFCRKFYYINKPEKLNGTLEGFIELKPEEIVINDQILAISEIQYLEIRNADYYKKWIGSGKSITSNLSNGVDNYVLLKKQNGDELKILFQLYNEFEMGKLQDVLTGYHLAGKMTFQNLVTVLKFDKKEIVQMQQYLEHVRLSGNE